MSDVRTELSGPSDPPAVPAGSAPAQHRVEITERGSFAFALCSCGWFAPARRSRDRARRDAEEHPVAPG